MQNADINPQLIFALMIIAVNTRTLSGNHAAAILLQSCFVEIARQHPGHSFHFISNKKQSQQSPALQNITYHVIEQKSGGPLLWKLWYNYKLPALLRKLKADVLVSADGICSLKTKLPQHLFINEVVSKKDDWYPKKYKRFMLANQQAFLRKAAQVISSSHVLQQQIVEQYKTDINKISVLLPSADERYQPLSWEDKEQVKEQYTGGKDYFLYAGSLQQRHNLINLLKAFSFFKRRQKSNMQLVIDTDNSADDDGFTASLETYKYRREVVLVNELSPKESQRIVAAAYAFVNTSWQENNFSNLVNAIHCRVPVLISDNNINRDVFADAVLYADPGNFEDIADKMMLLFKDEVLRGQCIEQGDLLLPNFSQQRNAGFLWETMLNVLQ